MRCQSRYASMCRLTRPLFAAALVAIGAIIGPLQAQAQKLQAWQYTSALNVPRYYHEVVVAGGHVYAIGGIGSDRATYLESVEYAAIQPDGSLGPWQMTSAMTTQRWLHSAAAANGYLYAMGGGPSGFTLSTSERAQILPDGSLGPWQLAGNLAVPRYTSTAVSVAGYLYLLGGSPLFGGIIASVERAAVMPDGSLGPWTSTAPLPVARTGHAAATSGSRVYVLGGSPADASYTSVIYAEVLPDGSLGSWNPTSSLTGARVSSGAVVLGGALHAIGGVGFSAICVDAETAIILPDGSLGPWSAASAMQARRCDADTAASATHVYAVGGNTSPVLASVEYTSAPPPVGGSVTGVNTTGVACVNVTTGQYVTLRLQATPSWDCEAAGLVVNPGDTVRQIIYGTTK
jgi:hypothetical protein